MDHDALGPIEQLELEVFVPQATDFSLQDLGVGRQTTVGQEDDEANGTLRSSGLSSIPLRTSLHFGGSLPLHYMPSRILIHCQD